MPSLLNVSGLLPLAGFPVTIIGRFWVTAEGQTNGIQIVKD
jgi:hypothetical protein